MAILVAEDGQYKETLRLHDPQETPDIPPPVTLDDVVEAAVVNGNVKGAVPEGPLQDIAHDECATGLIPLPPKAPSGLHKGHRDIINTEDVKTLPRQEAAYSPLPTPDIKGIARGYCTPLIRLIQSIKSPSSASTSLHPRPGGVPLSVRLPEELPPLHVV